MSLDKLGRKIEVGDICVVSNASAGTMKLGKVVYAWDWGSTVTLQEYVSTSGAENPVFDDLKAKPQGWQFKTRSSSKRLLILKRKEK